MRIFEDQQSFLKRASFRPCCVITLEDSGWDSEVQGAGKPRGSTLSSLDGRKHFPGEVTFLLRPEG